jgi:hypothetical protein
VVSERGDRANAAGVLGTLGALAVLANTAVELDRPVLQLVWMAVNSRADAAPTVNREEMDT